MGKYNIDQSLKKLEKMQTGGSNAMLPIINAILALNMKFVKTPDEIKASNYKISGYKGSKLKLIVYEPKNIKKDAPCLIYFHGGAFILKAAPYHKSLVCSYAMDAFCKVVFVDYSLAEKSPFPTACEEGYAAYEWVCENAKALKIDKNKIAVGGDSAGGALAASLAQMVRDRKKEKLCYQMLIYPVLDSRQITESVKKYTDTPVWDSKANKQMWDTYLKNGDYGMRFYASPMEAQSHENLPDAYIEVAEFDCLHDEGIEYANALGKSGANVVLNETNGTVHGFELAGETQIKAQSMKARVNALVEAFKK